MSIQNHFSEETGQPLHRWEILVGAALYANGLVFSYMLGAYSAGRLGIYLTLFNAAVAAALSWMAVQAVRYSGTQARVAAMWLPLAWNGLMLSQLAYVGFLLIPLEIIVGSVLLRKRVRLRWSHAVLVSAGVRMISMGLTYAGAKPAVKLLFPWPG